MSIVADLQSAAAAQGSVARYQVRTWYLVRIYTTYRHRVLICDRCTCTTE